MERWTAKPRHARIALFMALVGLAAVPLEAGATSPSGPNGRIAFTSGRDDGGTVLSDADAQIWILSGPGGTATRLTTNNTDHHRHATWSPDRTKIAYAAGATNMCPWSIFVRDLTQPVSATNPLNVTPDAVCEDRPSWSPDGKRIAYQKRGAGTNLDIYVVNADGSGTELQVANPANPNAEASSFFPRPTWSPDSQFIYFAKWMAANDHDIQVVPADGSNLVGNSVVGGNTDDTQPQVSPDGSKLCFTRQEGTKNIFTAPISGFGATSLGTDGGEEYECAWSPDGSKIAFVRGAAGAGEILMRNSNATGNIDPVTDVGGRFDGNPDWTRNPSPTCTSGSATVGINSFVTINLSCTDPAPENNSTSKAIVTGPTNGTLGSIQSGQPATVVYTPKLNFSGSDSFTFKGNDGTSDSPPATVNITVGRDARAAIISSVSVLPRRWRLGLRLPRFSLAPRGTTIRWRLDEAARTTLTFAKAANGRRVRGRCVRPTRANRRRPRCTRYLTKGALSFRGKVGLNRVRFQGRLSRTRRLTIGRYRLRVGAVDAAGNRSRTRTTFFTIVRR
jgi:Tol biopolymer transport system component